MEHLIPLNTTVLSPLIFTHYKLANLTTARNKGPMSGAAVSRLNEATISESHGRSSNKKLLKLLFFILLNTILFNLK